MGSESFSIPSNLWDVVILPLHLSVDLRWFSWDYKPTLIYTNPPAGRGPIAGLTVLDNSIFVARHGGWQIEVYDAERFDFLREFGFFKGGIIGLTSCTINNCLYVIVAIPIRWDGVSSGIFAKRDGVVHRVHFSNGHTICEWQVGGKPQSLSINSTGNVVILLEEVQPKMLRWELRVVEYSPTGATVRALCLPPDVAHPRHALQLTSGQFVVSNGLLPGQQNRVSLINGDGKVVASFGRKRGSAVGQLNAPKYLLADKNGIIFVADSGNNRIVLLNQSLKLSRDLLSPDARDNNLTLSGLQLLCLDESRNRLYVGTNDGKVSIFTVRYSNFL